MKVARHGLLRTNGENDVSRASWLRECVDLSLISNFESVLNFGSRSRQEHVVSAEAAVGRTVVDGKENEEEDRHSSLETTYLSMSSMLF